MANFRWGTTRSSYVFPLYYYSEKDDIFLTPLFGKAGTRNDGFVSLLGPLFVHRRDSATRWQSYAIFPFMSLYDQEHTRGGWFWPLFSYKRYVEDDRRKGYALWPLMHYDFAPDDSQGGFLPVFYSRRKVSSYSDEDRTKTWTDRERFLYVFPTFWYNRDDSKCTETATGQTSSSREKSTGFWPLWQYKFDDDESRLHKDFSVLGWLYDRRQRIRKQTDEQSPEEYFRSRILWRLMHYERRGEKKSLDLFPFITYDSEKDTGFRKFSFAWRLFRYERDRNDNVKADVLFIPVLR